MSMFFVTCNQHTARLVDDILSVFDDGNDDDNNDKRIDDGKPTNGNVDVADGASF